MSSLGNMHALVSGAIGTVNPFVPATLQHSTGYSTQPDGTQVPAYSDPLPISCQVQALQYNDIVQLDGLNIQGVRRKIYVTGVIDGIVRVGKEGGDLITFQNGTLPEGNVWLAALVLEAWSGSGWVSVAITLQNGS